MTPDLNNRRFSDLALEKGIPPETIHEYDLAGSTFKLTQLFGKSIPCEKADDYIGKRQNPVFGEELESRLSADAKIYLIKLIEEAIAKIEDLRTEVPRSFKINSEAIRLVIIEGLEKSKTNEKLYAEINAISPDDFNQVIVYVRKILLRRRQIIEDFAA